MWNEEDVMTLTPRYTRFELAALRAAIYPEEDRHKYTAVKWNGSGFRHYRDPKVICLEHYRPKPKPQSLYQPQPNHKPAV